MAGSIGRIYGSGMPRKALRRIFSLFPLAVLFLSSCAAPASIRTELPDISLVWPPQPEGPRIVWIRSIASADDAGLRKGFWDKLADLITGGEDHWIVRPYGVHADDRERLAIADPGGGVIHYLDTKAGRYRIVGAEKDSPIRTPIGIAGDRQGFLYITDSKIGMVFRYDPADDTLTPFLKKKLQRPTGIVYSPILNMLYVSDTAAGQIVKIDMEGVERGRIGSFGERAAEFNHPTDLAVDRKGQIYVTDALNYRIKIFTAEGLPLSQIGTAGDMTGYLNKPKGIAVDSEGHIYVCDAMHDAVQVFDSAGRLLVSFGGTGSGPGQFWMPSGLYIDGQDYIYVSDTYNQRVQIFRYVSSPPPAVPTSGGDSGKKKE